MEKANGRKIVAVQGPAFQYVGSWSAADIDQDIADFSPFDAAADALAWIESKFSEAGISPLTLTDKQQIKGNEAMLWKLVIHYLEASQIGETCPDGCKTPEILYRKVGYSRKRCCEALQAIGFTDASICPRTPGKSWQNLMIFSSQGINT